MELNFELHPAQAEIFQSTARFKCVAAGRRFGKSYYAAITLILEGLKNVNEKGYDLRLKEVYYIAPTFEQAKKIMWPLIKELGRDVIRQTHENTGVLTLVNGRRVSIKGSDRPDSLRGIGLSYVVLDEYAFMKPEVWETIIRPSLQDVEGAALFIGTPDGKNHFYKLFTFAGDSANEEWEAFKFFSTDNPYLRKEEIESSRRAMSEELFRQEMQASFESQGGKILKPVWFKPDPDGPTGGTYHIAVDLAGFTTSGTVRKGQLKIRDETAIAVVKSHGGGWWIQEIIHGRWDVRETSNRIFKAILDTKCASVGIERGALRNAVQPYLDDEMRRYSIFVTIKDLTHGNRAKADRIRWALQGRAEKGRISYRPGEWVTPFMDQISDFPSPLTHDDMIDSLSYIDQLATPIYSVGRQPSTRWTPGDIVAGY